MLMGIYGDVGSGKTILGEKGTKMKCFLTLHLEKS